MLHTNQPTNQGIKQDNPSQERKAPVLRTPENASATQAVGGPPTPALLSPESRVLKTGQPQLP